MSTTWILYIVVLSSNGFGLQPLNVSTQEYNSQYACSFAKGLFDSTVAMQNNFKTFCMPKGSK